MITIKGDLILEKDTEYNEDLTVQGNILCKDGEIFNLKVNGDIDAWDINAMKINARKIDAMKINARKIDARKINARNIDASNIDAWNINASNINAWNINAWNINAWNIDAWDINYYAVCFAYNNINCKSIKGRRENCRHFCLDGEITIKEDKPKCKECGREL